MVFHYLDSVPSKGTVLPNAGARNHSTGARTAPTSKTDRAIGLSAELPEGNIDKISLVL
jgi:hypothetical protein